MEFYNVKKRAKVKVADGQCTKVVYVTKTAKGDQKRYAARAVDNDGTNLTKFLSLADYEKLKCPEGKPAAKKAKKAAKK